MPIIHARSPLVCFNKNTDYSSYTVITAESQSTDLYFVVHIRNRVFYSVITIGYYLWCINSHLTWNGLIALQYLRSYYVNAWRNILHNAPSFATDRIKENGKIWRLIDNYIINVGLWNLSIISDSRLPPPPGPPLLHLLKSTLILILDYTFFMNGLINIKLFQTLFMKGVR